jgi:hypothetical protein
VVLALADPNAPVMSMTNGIECYVQQAISALRVRLLDVIPRNIRWVEIDSEGEYSVVTFDWDGEIPLHPKWVPTTKKEVSRWLGVTCTGKEIEYAILDIVGDGGTIGGLQRGDPHTG